LGVLLLTVDARDPSEFEGAFAKLDREKAHGLVVSSDQLFSDHATQLVGLAAAHALPTIYARREPTVAGGLMSLGTDLKMLFAKSASTLDEFSEGRNPPTSPYS
jgi:putative tryptophan/tyrosine transport system substrate-binding protein